MFSFLFNVAIEFTARATDSSLSEYIEVVATCGLCPESVRLS